jgi:hypothetical protein
MKVGEIFVLLGFEVDDSKLKTFEDGVRKLTFQMGALSAMAGVAVAAVNAFTSGPIDTARNLDRFRKATGQSTDDLQRWISANERFGISAGETQGIIEGLAEKLAELKMTGKGGGDFAEVSTWLKSQINPVGNTNPFVVLENLRLAREKFLQGGGSEAQFSKLIERIGVTSSMIQSLSLDYEEFIKGATILSPEQITGLTQYGQLVGELGSKLKGLKGAFTYENAENLTKGIDLIYKSVDLLAQGFGNLMDVWAEFPVATTGVIGYFLWLINPLKKASLLLGAILLAAKALKEINKDIEDPNYKISFSGDGKENLFDQIYKNFFAKKGEDISKVPLDVKFNDIMRGLTKSFSPEAAESWERRRAMTIVQQADGTSYRLSGAKNATVNNTFNIHSNQDPNEIGNTVIDKMDDSVIHSLQEINNGGY